MSIRRRFLPLFHRIQSSSFIKNVLTLSSGTALRIVITFFSMPVVGRLYTPAAIGDYTLITADAGVISSVACLGMMTSFMLPEKDEEARGLSRLVTYSTLMITTLAVLILWLCSGFYRIFQTEEISYSLSLAVLWLYIVTITVNDICYSYTNRHRLYRVLFWNPVIYAGVSMFLAIVFGFLNWGFLGYTAAHILANIFTILHLIRYMNPYAAIHNPAFRCIPILKEYRRFPIFQMPANLIGTLAQWLSAQMLKEVYSSNIVGMYSMTNRILSLPITLLAASVSRIYFREASERYRKGQDVGKFSFRILQANIKIAILPICILMIFGEQLFALFLGEKWREAGTFASVLGLYYLLKFCQSCLTTGFIIIRRNRNSLHVTLLSLALNLLLYLIVRHFQPDIIVCMLLLSLFNCCNVIFEHGYFFWLTGFPLSRYFRFLLIYIALPAFSCWLVRWFLW